MNSRLHFMVAFVFKIAAPQMLQYSIGTDSSLILKCVTVDVSSTIVFKLDTANKGGCSSNGNCNTGIPGYLKPTQEITITEMVISPCNETRDTGNWTCTYGVSTSPEVIIADCSEDTSTPTGNSPGGANPKTDNDNIRWIGLGLGIPVLIGLCLLGGWMLKKKFNNEKSKCEEKPENSKSMMTEKVTT